MAKSMYLCQGPSRQTEEIIKMSSTCTNMENVIHHNSGMVPWASSNAPSEQVMYRPTGPMVPRRFQSSKKKTIPRPWLYKCSILSHNGFSTNNPITLANHLHGGDEDPIGDGGASHNLRPQHFVDDDGHHLRVRVP